MDAAPPGSASVVEPAIGPAAPAGSGAGAEPATAVPPRLEPGDGAQPDDGAQPGLSGEGGAGSAAPEPAADAEGRPFSRRTTRVLTVLAVAILAGTMALRFWTTSDLWLDEALTVNIAREPLHLLPSFLRRDGAPPLYYLLLHFWTGWFGTSDVAVRSLSGVMGVVTVPLAWLAGKRLAGRTVAWAASLLVATSPFAIRYSTETRMYSLVILLTVLGYLALDRALRRPRAGNLVAVAAVTALLLYSHYWSIYLIGTVVLWLAWKTWRGQPQLRPGARASLAASLIGCLTFVPWLPTFFYQSHHTGTPWATPANFAAMVNAVASFAGGGTNGGRALALIFFALAGLGVFGAATDRFHIDLDIRTRPWGRPLAITVVGTLAAAIAGGFITNSAFDARYASVVFIPLILLVSLGLITFRDRRIRVAILALAVVAGLASSISNVTTNRTQAGQVAAAIAATAKPGDIVAYCPDQLGPAVNRLLPNGRYQQTTFPRGTGPVFVDWVDYAAASKAGSSVAFSERLESMAASKRQIYLVWAPGYQTLGTKCEGIVQTLQGDPRFRAVQPVAGNPDDFYQPMWLVRFTPTTP
ncbi:MAG TPA: glycosyltransferase family 39 protein [Acidimicrobiales bacterium]|nr:glycosyltransferase family 39 protein [Acidimicrobiales bacterium]